MKNCLGLLLLSIAFTQFSCTKNVQDVVDDAIKAHGGDVYKNVNVEFDFRDKHYVITNEDGFYQYERSQTDSSGNRIQDFVTDGSFNRNINGVKAELPDSTANAYASSVNSVAYFFLLPAPLNDEAVRKELLEEVIIKGETYNVVEVTFAEKGGGDDFQDRYLFWIHKGKNTVDYFAYSYEVDGGGVRFREAYNVRTQNGLRFCDYRNYGFEDTKTPLEELPKLFETKKLPLLSSIENKNVKVTKP